MKVNVPLLAVTAALFIFVSCQKDIEDSLETGQIPLPPATDSIPVSNPKSPYPDNIITTSFQGKVLDENGLPLKNAQVMSGQKTTLTDNYGIFRLSEVAASEQSAFIRVVKEGYLMGSRTIMSEANGLHFVQIKLLRKTLKATIDNASGGVATISPKAQVRFQSNSVVTESGQAYSGKVLVYGALLDPTSEDFSAIMPGDLRGLNADSVAVALKSYGMLNIVMESESGAKLQLDHEKMATISLRVAESLLPSAPKEIPLWHFSETDGKWREEGKAVLNNGIYTGEVSHFSTWNCDMPMEFVSVTLRVTGLKGRVLAYTHVKFTDTRSGYSDTYTDSTGYLVTWVPKGTPLVIEILNECNGVLFSKTSGPLNKDTDLGTIQAGSVQTVNISGTVIDCNGQPATAGKATLYHQGLYYSTGIVDGEYIISIDNCETSSSDPVLYVSDPATHYLTEQRAIRISGRNVDGGQFTICNMQLLDYVLFTLGADSVHMQIPNSATIKYDEFTGDGATQVYFTRGTWDLGNWNEITIEFYDTIPHVANIPNPLPIRLMNEEYVAVGPLVVDVKEIGKIGEEIYLTFSGVYKHASNQIQVPLKGEMRVIRQK